jgi:hypothetical protein
MEYIEGPSMALIGLRVMPLYPTQFKSATYPVIPKEVMLKLQDTARSNRGSYNRGDWKYERGKYDCSFENGWEEPMDDDDRIFFDQEAPGQADIVATNRAMSIILRAQEKRIASKVFNATNFTAHPVTNEWDDATNATPIEDVGDGILSFRTQCGMLPDALIITYYTFRHLKQCDEIVNRLKYTFPGIDINKMTSDQLAAVFDVPQVLVAGAVYDAAGQNLDASITDIWDKEYASLVKISNGNDMPPGIGRTFLWTADSRDNAIVEQYREENIRSDVYRVRHNTDESLMRSVDTSDTTQSDIAAACCYLFANIST